MEMRPNDQSQEFQTSTTEVQTNLPSLLLRGTGLNQTNGSTQTPSTSRGPGIHWSEGTVDNEFLGKKKSNCCCIYEKPRRWDESSSSSSSSSSEDEGNPEGSGGGGGLKRPHHVHCTDHCRGHTKRCYRKPPNEVSEVTQSPTAPTEQTDQTTVAIDQANHTNEVNDEVRSEPHSN